MKCKKCGNELREDAKFCDKCGSLVEMEDEVTEPKETITEKKDETIETEEKEIETKDEEIIAETTSETTKKCKKCGSELDKDTRFCGKCGAPVDSEEKDNTTNSKMNKKNAVSGVLSKHADLGKDMKNAVSGVLSNHADLGKDIKKAASDTLSNHADLGKNMKNAASNAFSNHKDSRKNIENEVSNELPNLERKQKEKTGLTGSYEKMNKKCKGKLPLYLLVVFVLIMSMAAIGSGSDSDTDSNSDSDTPSVTTESNDATENDETTPEMTAAEIKENTESIDVTYDGETKAGTVLDGKNDGIEVTATLNDDTEKVVTDWKVETAKTLEKGGTTKVRIIYGDKKTILEVECSTNFTEAEKKANFIAECQTYTYKKLAQEPDAMLYKSIKVSGEVLQVINNDDSTGYRVAMNGNYDTVVYVEYDKTLEKRIIEDEYVSFYGYCADLLSYTTVMGAEQSIPAVVAVYIKR